MKKVTLVYISLTGNTNYFISNLKRDLEENNFCFVECINVKDIVKEKIPFFEVQDKFITFVPTYLEGGNGVDTGYTEILTTPLREFLRYNNNYKNCMGVVGSGNKNFNMQYCLTAKQYSDEFGMPMIDDFELRGTSNDVERISKTILELFEIV